MLNTIYDINNAQIKGAMLFEELVNYLDGDTSAKAYEELCSYIDDDQEYWNIQPESPNCKLEAITDKFYSWVKLDERGALFLLQYTDCPVFKVDDGVYYGFYISVSYSPVTIYDKSGCYDWTVFKPDWLTLKDQINNFYDSEDGYNVNQTVDAGDLLDEDFSVIDCEINGKVGADGYLRTPTEYRDFWKKYHQARG